MHLYILYFSGGQAIYHQPAVCIIGIGRKKANETLYFEDTNPEAADISSVADVALSLRVVDDDTYDTLLVCPDVLLKTSASGTIGQLALDQGKELANQDGIRIVGRYVEEYSFWGVGVVGKYHRQKYGGVM